MNSSKRILKTLFSYRPKTGEDFVLRENHTDTNAKPRPKKPPEFPRVSSDLRGNLEELEKIYGMPRNSDIMFREFGVSFGGSLVPAAIVFIDGLVNSIIMNENILEPLMLESRDTDPRGSVLEYATNTLLPQNQLSIFGDMAEVVKSINIGCCGIFIDGMDKCLICDVKTWEHRSVSEPLSENVVRGPQEGFCEILRVNTALIRKNMTDSNLTIETKHIGSRSNTPLAVAYLRDVVNPALLSHVHEKLDAIDIDYCFDSGVLEQLIEDRQYAFAPQINSTERPDRACSAIADGRVVLILSGSPYALILPALFSDFIHSVEDRYLRAPYGILIRAVRIIAMFLSVFLSSFFLAVVTFHKEFIPTQLLLTIQASSQNVAFPTAAQLIFLELLFEILHEASIRMPKHIGSIIGIVGGLVIGTSLVSANIVSPVIVICTATSVLSTFANPNYMQNIHFRILRLLFILSAALGGLPYVGVMSLIVFASLVRLKSFGVPYFAPFAPYTKRNFISSWLRTSLFSDDIRSDAINPQKKYKKAGD